ncbi:MAG: tetratricopeptide repeat protein [Bacteroidales bacterium]|nr:tetratricopeptide repeat protein [Bacteroidales bacterium]
MNVRQYIFLLFVLLLGNSCFSQTDIRPLLEKGNAFYSKGEYRNAAVQYKHACQLDSTSFDAWYNFGNALCEMQKYILATEAYDRALRCTNDKTLKANIYHNIGNAYFQQNQFEKALVAYKQSLLLNPKAEDTRVNLALTQAELKKRENAENDNKDKKQEEKPKPTDFAKECLKKAMDLVAQGKFKEALGVLEEGQKKDKTVSLFSDVIQKLTGVVGILQENE